MEDNPGGLFSGMFSIESDTDLSETAELIEEYDVFDPARPRPKVILVIGGPGSGKGTQSLKIAERYGFNYISVGELLRKKIHSTSSNRKWSLIAKIITTGELAPQETSHAWFNITDIEGVLPVTQQCPVQQHTATLQTTVQHANVSSH